MKAILLFYCKIQGWQHCTFTSTRHMKALYSLYKGLWTVDPGLRSICDGQRAMIKADVITRMEVFSTRASVRAPIGQVTSTIWNLFEIYIFEIHLLSVWCVFQVLGDLQGRLWRLWRLSQCWWPELRPSSTRQEQITDLLEPSSNNLQIREDAGGLKNGLNMFEWF